MYNPSDLNGSIVTVDQPTNVGNYIEDRKWISEIANSGFTLIINYTPLGFKYYDSTFDKEWQTEYIEKSYVSKDPIVLSALSSISMTKRWSEIRLPDPWKVFQASAKYGLIYGVSLSRTKGFKKSLLTAARYDREFEDSELQSISDWFDSFVDLASEAVELTEKEVEVVRLLAMDMGVNEIAGELDLTPAAVKARLKSARKRVGCRTNFSLIHKASRASLL
ncbi:MAG: LuxR C-terminal-related transcriptional regulator [Pseudomonadota bacterium]